MYALRLHAVIVLCYPPEDFVGSIGRSIINNNDFELHVELREKAANRISNRNSSSRAAMMTEH
ncbi:MAG TPA: hypothetical protein VLK33_11895 [Terriglobales bacterium]|nr:hypothetical protein [Terriglobales bacterium]